MEHKDLQKVVNKDRLLKLRNKYIKELEVLKRDISSKGGKKVHFSSEIEQNWKTDTTCACDLECILNGNKWKCKRRGLFI